MIVFICSLVLFIIAVPVSVFYAIGYRFDFSDQITNITSVGGMYLRSDTQHTEMFVDNEPVEDMRIFQKAAYIQNLEAGIHRVHVQGKGVQTWVKQLPVYAHYVTEVASFNLPETPQVRIITPWIAPATGDSVTYDTDEIAHFAFASTSNQLVVASSTVATSTLDANPEYEYVESLFASSTAERMALQQQRELENKNRFTFGTAPATTTPVLVGTTTKIWRDFTLFEKGEDVYVKWNGSSNDVPYYYCVEYSGEKKTSLEYGRHVYEALLEQLSGTTDLLKAKGQRLCRSEIRIDRKEEAVSHFDFFPNTGDLILMGLDDGIYAVEADDRAWQNTELLYPGSDVEFIQDGGRIYVKDGDYYLEVFTEIASQ
jgi:hypothetical protein